MTYNYQEWIENGRLKIFCKCGCGNKIIVKENHKYYGIPEYILGHYRTGKSHSEDSKIKISKKLKNRISPMKGKKHSIETKQQISNSEKGRISPMKGKNHSDKTKIKISENKKGKYPSEETKIKISTTLNNHVVLEKTKQKISATRQGISEENMSNWIGYSTSLNNLIRNSDQYNEWRLQIFGRDNFTCQCCGVRGTYLEVHHIKPFNEIIKEYNIKKSEDALNCEMLWDLNNGITYCTKCHDKLKNKGGKIL